MASPKRDRQRASRETPDVPVARGLPSRDRPTLVGRWEHFADLDPGWVFRETKARLGTAKGVARTREKLKESLELASMAYTQLPLHLRPGGDVRPDLRRQDGSFLLVHPLDHENTDVFAFKRSDDWVLHIRLSERTASATAAIYRHGEQWSPPYVGANIELPEGLPFPKCCPECQASWVDYPWGWNRLHPPYSERQEYSVILYCKNLHGERQHLTHTQLSRLQRAMNGLPPRRQR